MSNLQYNDILTVSPEQTFFRADFKRHTDFDKSIQEVSFSSTPDFNTTAIANIPKSGTLLSDLFLEIVLPPPAASSGGNGGIYTTDGSSYVPSSTSSYLNWVNGIGFALIDYIELEINGNIVDKHSGLWLDIWNELTDKSRKEWDMVKKYDNKDKLKYVNYEKTKLIIPLKFFFCVNKSLSLPMKVLTSNAVKITIKFNSLEKLLISSTTLDSSETSAAQITSVKLFAEFNTLQKKEEDLILNSENNFKIPVVQYLEQAGSGSSTTYTVNTGEFSLTGAIKEIIWVFRHNKRISKNDPNLLLSNNSIKGNDHFNYSNTHQNEVSGDYEMFDNCLIRIRNTEIVTENSHFFGKYARLSHGSGTTKNIYSYSFAINPEKIQPSGHFNFSIMSDTISFLFKGIPGHSNKFYNNGQTKENGAKASDYILSMFAIG